MKTRTFTFVFEHLGKMLAFTRSEDKADCNYPDEPYAAFYFPCGEDGAYYEVDVSTDHLNRIGIDWFYVMHFPYEDADKPDWCEYDLIEMQVLVSAAT